MRALKIWGMTMVVVIAVLGLYIYQNNREYQIILLNTNDSHGSILPVDSVGGMAERATFIRMVREKNPYVLLVDAGDINTGQAISNRADAKPDILAYNYMGYDAVTVGNHEFDKPLNVLLKQMQWAEFPFVTSNIQRNGTPLGVEYLIKEIGGVKIGIFGLTTKNTENVSIHAGEVTFENEVMAARKVVKLLKKQQVNLIIGLVHLGFEAEFGHGAVLHVIARLDARGFGGVPDDLLDPVDAVGVHADLLCELLLDGLHAVRVDVLDGIHAEAAHAGVPQRG